MLIDIHVHCAELRHPGIARPNGNRYPSPEELVATMDAAGLDKAVVLSAVSPECRYTMVDPEEVASMCARFPDRLVPFCNADPRYLTNSARSDFRPMLAAYKEQGFRGVGEYMPNLPFDDPLNMNFFAQVEEFGWPLTFHIGPTIGGCYGCYDEIGLPRLEKVLKAFPRLRFLGHSQPFWAEISADVAETTRGGYPAGPVRAGRLVELMRSYPNLQGDLSANSGYNAITRDPEFGYAFMEEFQDRLYFGTDICNTEQETPIVAFFERLQKERLVSAETVEKIAWKNAARLLEIQ